MHFPVAALTVLALILGYGLQRIQESANTVDRADVVILHGNRLIKLMVDEETGLRGFLLVRNPVFLQPLHEADQQIEPEFDTLFSLVHVPTRSPGCIVFRPPTSNGSRKPTRRSIPPPMDPDVLEQHLLQRKQDMDNLRAQMDEFLDIVSGRRAAALRS